MWEYFPRIHDTRENFPCQAYCGIISRTYFPAPSPDPMITSTPIARSEPSPALRMALRRVLRPLAQLMLANGITLPFLVELLKRVFVEVADSEFRIDGKAQTDSRVSLLSGVHRKDVRRLRGDTSRAQDETAPAAITLGAQLVAAWVTNPPFVDQNDQPRPLPRLASEGGEVSFEALVTSISTDIRARAVLDELLRLGVVYLDESLRVCLNTEAFVPQKGFAEKAYYLGHNVHDHLAAAVANLASTKSVFLERSVHYDALSPESIKALAALSATLGMQVLKAVNREASELERNDERSTQPRQRMTLGLYFYSEPTQPRQDQP